MSPTGNVTAMDAGELPSAADRSRRGDRGPPLPAAAADRLAAGLDGPIERRAGLDATAVARRLCRQAAEGAPHGAAVATGVGGEGDLHVGTLLRPARSALSVGCGVVCASIAAAGALASAGLPARPRWPDRVVVDADPWRGTPFYPALPPVDRRPPRTVASVAVDRLDPDRPGTTGASDGHRLGVVTSVRVAGGPVDRAGLVVGLVANLLARCRSAEVSTGPLRAEWRGRDATVGRRLRVDRPGGRPVTGRAVDLTDRGGLVVVPGRSRGRFRSDRVEVPVRDRQRVGLLEL